MSDTGKNIKFRFSLSADSYSPYWELIQYLDLLKKADSRRLVLDAAAAYWSPFAAMASGKKGGELRSLVTDCLHRLKLQEMELMSQFPIEAEAVEVKPLRIPDNREPVSFSFFYRVYDTSYFPLVKYLLNESGVFSLTQKVLWSCQAFWGVIALRELEGQEAERLTGSATNSICFLRQHVSYLKSYFAYREVEDGDQETNSRTTENIDILNSGDEPPNNPAIESDSSSMSAEELDLMLRYDPVNDPWRINVFNSRVNNVDN